MRSQTYQLILIDKGLSKKSFWETRAPAELWFNALSVKGLKMVVHGCAFNFIFHHIYIEHQIISIFYIIRYSRICTIPPALQVFRYVEVFSNIDAFNYTPLQLLHLGLGFVRRWTTADRLCFLFSFAPVVCLCTMYRLLGVCLCPPGPPLPYLLLFSFTVPVFSHD